MLRWGRERARTAPWRGQPDVALLAPLPDAPPPSGDFVRRCLATLAARGYTRVVTSALSPLEQAGFLAAGFAVEERLHLLGVDLGGPLPPVPPGAPLVRPGRRREGEVLAVDHAAFRPFWRFDGRGLADARAATPRTRYRAALDPAGAVEGYAICGRAARRGFVQRLAVAPGRQGAGTGRRLLLDGLWWLRRRGVERAVVNTQLDNEAALHLYLAVGFEHEPAGLSVLAAELGAPAAQRAGTA